MFSDSRTEIVVSEPDLEAALSHLRKLPYRTSMPLSWDRKRFMDQLKAALGARPKPGQCVSVAPGVFAIVKPFGVDLTECEPDGRLQAWLAIRAVSTDPKWVTVL